MTGMHGVDRILMAQADGTQPQCIVCGRTAGSEVLSQTTSGPIHPSCAGTQLAKVWPQDLLAGVDEIADVSGGWIVVDQVTVAYLVEGPPAYAAVTVRAGGKDIKYPAHLTITVRRPVGGGPR